MVSSTSERVRPAANPIKPFEDPTLSIYDVMQYHATQPCLTRVSTRCDRPCPECHDSDEIAEPIQTSLSPRTHRRGVALHPRASVFLCLDPAYKPLCTSETLQLPASSPRTQSCRGRRRFSRYLSSRRPQWTPANPRLQSDIRKR